MIARALVRPIVLLTTQPIIQVFTLYQAILIGTYYILLVTFTRVFTETYLETTGIASLNYLALALGAITGESFTSASASFLLLMRPCRIQRPTSRHYGHGQVLPHPKGTKRRCCRPRNAARHLLRSCHPHTIWDAHLWLGVSDLRCASSKQHNAQGVLLSQTEFSTPFIGLWLISAPFFSERASCVSALHSMPTPSTSIPCTPLQPSPLVTLSDPSLGKCFSNAFHRRTTFC